MDKKSMEKTSLISTKTLVRIAEHGDKLIRLALFVAEMDAKFMLGATSFLDNGSSAPEIAEAFDKDLGSTAVMLKKIALIVENLNDDHLSPELLSKYRPEDCDLRVLFPNHYDESGKTLTLFGVEMSQRTQVSSLENNDVKARIYNHVLGGMSARFPYTEFRKQLSVLKKLQDSEKPTADSQDFKIYSYAMLLSSVYEWSDFYAHIMESVNQEASFRRELTFEQRQLVDERIAGGRAMLDGVIKSSTYLTKDGVVQVASAHKNDAVLHAVVELTKSIDYIRAIEVDASASLTKIHDLLLQIKSMDLTVPDAFELKVRLLGQYRASGMFMTRSSSGELSYHAMLGVASPALRIVAVDPKSPTSIAHELAHFCDRDESDPVRNQLIHHFRDKMIDSPVYEEGIVSASYMNYLLGHREVFARLSEIGFTLLKVGFQPGDSVEDVKRKASLLSVEHDGERLSFDIALSKDFSTYLGRDAVSSWMYFDIDSWEPFELSMVHQLARNIYQDPSPECKATLRRQIESGLGHYNSLNHQRKKTTRRKRETTDDEKIAALFAKLSEKDLVKAVDVVIREGMCRHGDIAETLGRNMHKLDIGTRATTSLATLHNHIKALVGCMNVMLEHGYMADAHLTYEVMLRVSARLLVLFSDPHHTELEQQLFSDLTRMHVTGEMIGMLGESQKRISGSQEDPTFENPFEIPYSYGWNVTNRNRGKEDELLAEISPQLMQIRSRLLADSGAPGVVSSSLFEQPVELNDLVKARLVAGAFYHMARTSHLSEDAFDWWHQAQKFQILKSFAEYDNNGVRAIELTGEIGNVQALNAASLEWDTLRVQSALVTQFVMKHQKDFDAIPSVQLKDWILRREAMIQKENERNSAKPMSSSYLIMADYDNLCLFSPSAQASSGDLVLQYMQHSEQSLPLRESIVLRNNGGRPDTVTRPVVRPGVSLENVYSGTLLFGMTPARLLSGLIDEMVPDLKQAWLTFMVQSEDLKHALQDSLKSKAAVGLMNIDYDVQPKWVKATRVCDVSDVRKAAAVHPSAMFLKSLMLESGSAAPGSHTPSAILSSGMHAALIERLSDGRTPIALASGNNVKMLMSAKESVEHVATRAVYSINGFAAELFSREYASLPEVSVPDSIRPELDALKSQLDDFLCKAYQLSPEATQSLLSASDFAQRDYDVDATMKGDGLAMHQALTDLAAQLRTLSTPRLMAGHFLKPAQQYLEGIQERLSSPGISLAWEQDLLSTTPIDLQYVDIQIPDIDGAFDDAPVLAVQDVSLSAFSQEVQEQMAYFMSINENVPSAGLGPLMPKKHQMRLF